MEGVVEINVPLFRRGFGQVRATKEHADGVVVAGGVEYPVHRLILASGSEFFARSFGGSFSEAASGVVTLHVEDPQGVFPSVLTFLYEGDVSLSPANGVGLLAMADMLLIPVLKARVMAFLTASLDVDSVLPTLALALTMAQDELVPPCLAVAVKNFHVLSQADFSFLPPDTMVAIMADPALAVKSETAVFTAIGNYISSRSSMGSPCSSQQIAALYQTVRYPFLPYELLVQAQASPLVPPGLLVEGLMARLRIHEGEAGGSPDSLADYLPHDADRSRVLRHTPRPPYSITLRYRSDFDGNGVIHWIATRGGSNEWANPALPEPDTERPRVQVTVSSMEKGDPASFVALEPVQTWTKDVPASWVTWDLGSDYAVAPSHYSLRHGGNYKADSLRNWDLQGSTDGVSWSVLIRHVQDTTLSGPFATATWPIPLDHNQGPFRFFRVLQTGHNSSRHNFLVLCGFELYGDLYITTRTSYATTAASSSSPTSAGPGALPSSSHGQDPSHSQDGSLSSGSLSAPSSRPPSRRTSSSDHQAAVDDLHAEHPHDQDDDHSSI